MSLKCPLNLYVFSLSIYFYFISICTKIALEFDVHVTSTLRNREKEMKDISPQFHLIFNLCVSRSTGTASTCTGLLALSFGWNAFYFYKLLFAKTPQRQSFDSETRASSTVFMMMMMMMKQKGRRDVHALHMTAGALRGGGCVAHSHESSPTGLGSPLDSHFTL